MQKINKKEKKEKKEKTNKNVKNTKYKKINKRTRRYLCIFFVYRFAITCGNYSQLRIVYPYVSYYAGLRPAYYSHKNKVILRLRRAVSDSSTSRATPAMCSSPRCALLII